MSDMVMNDQSIQILGQFYRFRESFMNFLLLYLKYKIKNI